jgi:hypothetical protein
MTPHEGGGDRRAKRILAWGERMWVRWRCEDWRTNGNARVNRGSEDGSGEGSARRGSEERGGEGDVEGCGSVEGGAERTGENSESGGRVHVPTSTLGGGVVGRTSVGVSVGG